MNPPAPGQESRNRLAQLARELDQLVQTGHARITLHPILADDIRAVLSMLSACEEQEEKLVAMIEDEQEVE